jgi:hypothetical protein
MGSNRTRRSTASWVVGPPYRAPTTHGIEKEVVASATYKGQSMAQSSVYRAEHAMGSIWISADTPGLRKCMPEGRAATSYKPRVDCGAVGCEGAAPRFGS